MKQPWFSNKGQIIQISLQILTILIGLKLWPEMSASHMLTRFVPVENDPDYEYAD
jgi:hypothetical protein